MSPKTKTSSSANHSSVTTGRVTRSQTSNTLNQSAAHGNPSLVHEAQSSNLTSRNFNVSRRGRPLLGQSSMPSTSLSSITQHEGVVVVERLEQSSPRTPDNHQPSIQLVDLITPQAPSVRVNRRPLEVDLTCDLDDEVFVVLEDIVNPSRGRPSNLPICLGSSPPRSRMLGRRNVRTAAHTRLGNHTAAGHESPQLLHAETLPNADACPTVSQAPSQEINCPICLDTLSQIKQANQQMHSTICGHLFCGPCIREAIRTKHQCPTCRQRLDSRKIHPIFI